MRVRPGQFPVLEVRGDQRLNMPITGSGSAPIDLEFDPAAYTAKTPQIVVSWGAAATGAPAPGTPAVIQCGYRSTDRNANDRNAHAGPR